MFIGVVLFLFGGYTLGLAYVFSRDIPSWLYNNMFYMGSIVSLTGLLVMLYGVLSPLPIWFIRTGDEIANIKCDFEKYRGFCEIRLEQEPNERLVEEIINYYVKERKYKYLGIVDDAYTFKRKAMGLRRLWSKNVKVRIYFVMREDGSLNIHVDYYTSILLNPLVRGEPLHSYIEAEVYGLYRYIRSKWSRIYGEKEVEKAIVF